MGGFWERGVLLFIREASCLLPLFEGFFFLTGQKGGPPKKENERGRQKKENVGVPKKEKEK